MNDFLSIYHCKYISVWYHVRCRPILP